jgi:hypothetical protein
VFNGGKNNEGYSDPTASVALGVVSKEEHETDRRASDLVKVLKYIIRLAGFELTERVRLRDTKSGREYK